MKKFFFWALLGFFPGAVLAGEELNQAEIHRANLVYVAAAEGFEDKATPALKGIETLSALSKYLADPGAKAEPLFKQLDSSFKADLAQAIEAAGFKFKEKKADAVLNVFVTKTTPGDGLRSLIVVRLSLLRSMAQLRSRATSPVSIWNHSFEALSRDPKSDAKIIVSEIAKRLKVFAKAAGKP